MTQGLASCPGGCGNSLGAAGATGAHSGPRADTVAAWPPPATPSWSPDLGRPSPVPAPPPQGSGAVCLGANLILLLPPGLSKALTHSFRRPSSSRLGNGVLLPPPLPAAPATLSPAQATHLQGWVVPKPGPCLFIWSTVRPSDLTPARKPSLTAPTPPILGLPDLRCRSLVLDCLPTWILQTPNTPQDLLRPRA